MTGSRPDRPAHAAGLPPVATGGLPSSRGAGGAETRDGRASGRGAWRLRSADELVRRYQRAGDPFGWEKEIIARYLTEDQATAVGAVRGREHAKEYTVDGVVADALAYLDYAYGETLRHRNVEANRSVYKLDYWLWLLGQDERLVLAHGERGLYGANALRLAGEMLGRPEFPPAKLREFEDKAPVPMPEMLRFRLVRMANNEPCVIMCTDGCMWERGDDE